MIPVNRQYQFAIAAILLSATAWGLVWYPMRELEQAGLPVVWTTLVVYLAAALLGSVQLWLARHRLNRYFPRSLWLLALAAGLTNIAFLVALIEGEVVRVMLLFYLSPLWTVLIGHWWLGEKITTRSLLLIMTAMSGTFMMLWHPGMGFPWPHGKADWLALFASLCFSVNNVLGRRLAAVDMTVKTTAVFWGVVVVASVVLVLQRAQLPQIAPEMWLGVTLIGGLCFTVMTVLALYGLARMPVFRSAVLMLFELIVAALAAWWLTSERMSGLEWLGGLCIFIAAYGMARSGKGI